MSLLCHSTPEDSLEYVCSPDHCDGEEEEEEEREEDEEQHTLQEGILTGVMGALLVLSFT
jgi:hypothetical protein